MLSVLKQFFGLFLPFEPLIFVKKRNYVQKVSRATNFYHQHFINHYAYIERRYLLGNLSERY